MTLRPWRWCVVALMLSLSTGAWAAGPGEEQFLAAHEHYGNKNYAEALPLFREAFKLSESPNARLYVARCLRELGMLAEAYDEMQETVREATARAKSDDKYAGTRDAAAAELAQLEPRVGKVVVAVFEPPDGTEVKVNGRALHAAKLGQPVAVAPGLVVVEAMAPGRESLRKEIDIVGGGSQSVNLRFADAEPSDEPPPSPPVTPQTSGGEVRTAGFVVGGVGVASLVVFAVTGAMAKSKFDDVDEACGGVRCVDPATDADIDSGKKLALVANVTLGIGAAAVAAGTLMIVFGGPSEGAEARAPSRFRLAVAPQPGGMLLRGSF